MPLHWTQWASAYKIWQGMKERCYNENSLAYENYGFRGIKVCDRWRNSFDNFLADMGRRPSTAHSIDRINNDGNYEPGNCRWATAAEQNQNKRRANTSLQTDCKENLMAKSTQKRRKHPTLELNAGDVERATSECPANMSLKVKQALLKEIAEFGEDKAKQAKADAEQSANGGPNIDAYQEWLERNEGHEPPEANPDIVSDEDGIKYIPSKRDYAIEALLKEFRQALTDKQLQVWNLVMRHRMSYRKAANLLGINLSTLRDHLQLAKQQFKKFAEAIKNVEER